MKKLELIQKLQQRLLGKTNMRGDKAFLNFFIDYLQRLEIDHEKRFDFWRIDAHLPQIIADAFEEFRTSAEEWVIVHRRAYEVNTEHHVPDLTNVGDGIDRALVVQSLQYLFKEALGNDWIAPQLDAYLNAESYVLQKSFDKFLRHVYRKGLYELITHDTKRGMDGQFGKTQLRTFVTAGRIMFTFARPGKKDEISVSFVAEDGDPDGYSAGTQSVFATLSEAIAMIEDVIANWPSDQSEQAAVFNANEAVTIDVIAAMRQ